MLCMLEHNAPHLFSDLYGWKEIREIREGNKKKQKEEKLAAR